MNTEHKLQELNQQLDRLDTHAMQSRIEAGLRSAWVEHHSTQPTMNTSTLPRKGWRWLQLAIGIPSLAGLALITTFAIQPANPNTATLSSRTSGSVTLMGAMLGTSDVVAQPVSDATKNIQENYALKADPLDADNSAAGGRVEEYSYDDLVVENETPNDRAYTYTDGDQEKQLFDESVGLSVELKGELLDAIHTLRDQVATLNGQLVNISYYDTMGTVDIKLPADQLDTFEDTLKELDAHHTVEVDSYNVVNVSEEIVSIDEGIQQAQDRITQAQQSLGAAGLTDAKRQELADQIQADEDYIQEKQSLRDTTIANYDLVAVRVTLQQYQSLWSGNYTQYDRSTFSGMIKYELGKAIYTLIRSTGKLTIFLVWLLVYSIVLVPAYWLLRWCVRKLIRVLRKQA